MENRPKRVGRPTKYTEDMPLHVAIYLELNGKEQMKLPTVQGLAVYLNVNKDTLYAWSKEHEEFSDALDRLLSVQGEQLINDGIYGGKEVNATIVKLLLQNNHGMREKNDVELSGEITQLIITREEDEDAQSPS